MKVGDNVLISPDLTHQNDWVKGKVIEVEQNQFVGVVISAETSDGNVFFGYEDLFKADEVCMH
ncbi:transcriptional regulator [Prevotella melaninogenica]